MRRTIGLSALALIAGIALVADGSWLANAQQQTIKRTYLLIVDLPDIKGNQMNLWVADIAPGAETDDTLIRHLGLSMSWKVPLPWKWMINLRRRSKQVRLSWKCPTWSTTSKTRARPSRPKVWVSNTRPKARRFKSTPLRPGSRLRLSMGKAALRQPRG
jgi:hypothetical protein